MQCPSSQSDAAEQSALGLLRQRRRSGTIYTYDSPLTESELLGHLRARDKVVINSRAIKRQELEREIERLGFGDHFLVFATKGKHGECFKIEPWKGASPAREEQHKDAAA